ESSELLFARRPGREQTGGPAIDAARGCRPRNHFAAERPAKERRSAVARFRTAPPGRREKVRRWLAVLGTAIFLVIGPGIVAGLAPWWISRWRVQAPLWAFPFVRAVGVLLIIAALPVLLDSFARFALQG